MIESPISEVGYHKASWWICHRKASPKGHSRSAEISGNRSEVVAVEDCDVSMREEEPLLWTEHPEDARTAMTLTLDIDKSSATSSQQLGRQDQGERFNPDV